MLGLLLYVLCKYRYIYMSMITCSERWYAESAKHRNVHEYILKTICRDDVQEYPTFRHAWIAALGNNVYSLKQTLPAGTEPRTAHHRSPGGDRRGKRKRWIIFLEMTREGHRQSDERWKGFKGHVGETSERWGGAHMDFSGRIDIILNSAEPNWISTLQIRQKQLRLGSYHVGTLLFVTVKPVQVTLT